MRGRATLVALVLAALCLADAAGAQAAKRLDINGAFVGEDMPEGWGANKPGYWDEAGKVTLTLIPDLEMNALRVTSATRAMHMYCARRFPVSEGDQVVLGIPPCASMELLDVTAKILRGPQ